MSTIPEKPRTKDIFVEDQQTFGSFLLTTPVRRGLDEAGFYKPSPIQVKAIPVGKCGLDLIVKAKSGTGKTLVFVTIALEMIKVDATNLQVLIITPTREIANQIVDVVTTIGKYIEGMNVGLFIGGLSYETDVQRSKNCHIAVGTPGRVKHLVEQNHLNLKTVKLFILDEADKLLSEHFQSDINYLHNMLSEHKQFLAVSATMTNYVNDFLDRYMYSPTVVTPGVNNSVLLGLRQFVSVLNKKKTVVERFTSKIDDLVRIFSQVPFTQCLLFSNYADSECISYILNQLGWSTTFISNSQSQEDRLKAMSKLQNLECKILLTTDLTAKGIDASNVDLVVNYYVPKTPGIYLHRMGRTGRYSSIGICITIAFKGKELLEFKHILGDIGGTELFASQLPTGQITDDVWKCDLNSLEKIQGLVSEIKETSAEKLAHWKKNSKNKFKDLWVAEKRKEPEAGQLPPAHPENEELINQASRLSKQGRAYGSPGVRAVLITAEALGLKLDCHNLDIFKGAHLKEDYLKINPLHTVPTLDDNGSVVYDSHAIMIYLIEKYGKGKVMLYPDDIYQRALVHQGLAFDLGYLFPILKIINFGYYNKEITAVTPKMLQETNSVYEFLETMLKRNKWISGEHISLADISCYVTTTSLDYHVPIKANEFPTTANWLERCKQQPYFKNDSKYLQCFYDLMKMINAKPYDG